MNQRLRFTVEGEAHSVSIGAPFVRFSFPAQVEMMSCPTKGCAHDSKSVYVLQRGGPDGPLKIGNSNDARRRARELQTACPEPLLLLAASCGGEVEERALHSRLSSYRIAGEWFRCAPEVLSVIAARVVLPALFHQLRDDFGAFSDWESRSRHLQQARYMKRLGIKIGGIR